MKDLNGLNLEIERIHADIKLLEQSIDNLKKQSPCSYDEGH